MWVRTLLRRGILDTLCDKVCHWLAVVQWLSLGTLASSTNKTDCHEITEILLKVVLNTITLIVLMHFILNVQRVSEWAIFQLQYSQRHSVINHCDRRITHLDDLDISFILSNISLKFVLHLECYLLLLKRHIKIRK